MLKGKLICFEQYFQKLNGVGHSRSWSNGSFWWEIDKLVYCVKVLGARFCPGVIYACQILQRLDRYFAYQLTISYIIAICPSVKQPMTWHATIGWCMQHLSWRTRSSNHVLLEWTLCKLETTYPEAAFIVAGDFNKANLKKMLPKF
jgi:hypothetical protein